MGLERLVEAAERLLGPVMVVDDLSQSSRARVARLRAAGDTATVIVKHPVEAEGLARELEALRLLPAGMRPALVAADDAVVVTEDLGPGPSLADVLLGDDPTAAEAALLAWATALGAVLRTSRREGTPPERPDFAGGVEHLRQLADEFGTSVPAGGDDDAERLSAVLGERGPWLAFGPGDTCPDNNRMGADGSVRFFDFEGAGWRHAAMEAAYCRAPFCTCWCVARLPDGMTGRMEDAFLDALAPPEPERFRSITGLAAVSYTLTSLDWFRRFLADDRRPGPPDITPCTGRQYVYARMHALAAETEELPALAGLAGDLARAIAGRWPAAADMPPYPAFSR